MNTLGSIEPEPVAHAEHELERLAGLQRQLALDRERLAVELEAAESNAGEASIRARLGDKGNSFADAERLARSVREELDRTGRDIEAASSMYRDAIIALGRVRCAELRKTAAEKRVQAGAIRDRVRPLLDQLTMIEGVAFTFAILECQPGFEATSTRLLREANTAEREARGLEQAQRFRDARNNVAVLAAQAEAR